MCMRTGSKLLARCPDPYNSARGPEFRFAARVGAAELFGQALDEDHSILLRSGALLHKSSMRTQWHRRA
ncbi:MAG: hypothetical protein E5299_00322 [Burkholderia gladioli]|nr:MAG: hypothetical protein E5299_00322 [Burkholderia gladioli]